MMAAHFPHVIIPLKSTSKKHREFYGNMKWVLIRGCIEECTIPDDIVLMSLQLNKQV